MLKPFKFKQFTIHQDKCAMKIGTDAVLLGAWANIEHNPKSVLDIGSGTGVIALMLAQRSSAQLIDVIEIDDDAYEQCVDNFENSTWSDRLFCYHASLQEFVDEAEDKYDLIISNPPFYSSDYKSNNNQRNLARFEDSLPFDHLIESASKLLSDDGKFAVILPFQEEEKLIALASEVNLLPNSVLRVKGNPNTELKRSLLEFSFRKKEIKIDKLIIETSRHQYTKEYINLTKDFYLKM
ncbi:MAG: tRNA (adenine-N(6)-)-methyltransferase [Bacteroidetes bacterium]|nr:MAG: tRNA (adenine-N(6)-)-methyltransferase [Bacteroidota bacterium]